MKLHSFGIAVACGKCGQPSKALYAETPHAAIYLGQGLCPACHAQQPAPLAEPARAGRGRTRRSLVDLVEAERERELMRGELTGTCKPCEKAEATEEVEGDGSEG